MRGTIARVSALVLGAVIVGACGGSGGTAAPGGSAGPTAAPGGTASQPSSGAAPTPAASQPGSGGQVAGACELVTTDEVAGVLGAASVTSQLFAGPPDTCVISDPGGKALLSWVYTTQAGKPLWGALTGDPSTEMVSGLGDSAAFVANTGLLVLKGDHLLTVVVGGGSDLDEDAAKEVAKQIAGLAVPRM